MDEARSEHFNKSRRRFLTGALGAMGLATGAVIGSRLPKIDAGAEAEKNPSLPVYSASSLERKINGELPLDPDHEIGVYEITVRVLNRDQTDYFHPIVRSPEIYPTPLLTILGKRLPHFGELEDGDKFKALMIKGGQKASPLLMDGSWYEISGRDILKNNPKMTQINPDKAYFLPTIFATSELVKK